MGGNDDYEIKMKVAVVGDSCSGKSTICRVLSSAEGKQGGPTIGIDFHEYLLQTDDSPALVQLWDLGGRERFGGYADSFIGGSVACIVVFDLSLSAGQSARSISKWTKLVAKSCPGCPVLVLGNKSDLVPAEMSRPVRVLARGKNYGECSAERAPVSMTRIVTRFLRGAAGQGGRPGAYYFHRKDPYGELEESDWPLTSELYGCCSCAIS